MKFPKDLYLNHNPVSTALLRPVEGLVGPFYDGISVATIVAVFRGTAMATSSITGVTDANFLRGVSLDSS